VGFLTVSALVGHGIVEGVRAVGHAVGGGLNVGPLTADNVVGLGIRTAGDTVGAYLDTIGRAVNLAKNLAGGNSPYPGTAEDALKTAIGAAYTAVDVAKRGPLRRGGELLLGVARKRG
jgi:hypothetical protein